MRRRPVGSVCAAVALLAAAAAAAAAAAPSAAAGSPESQTAAWLAQLRSGIVTEPVAFGSGGTVPVVLNATDSPAEVGNAFCATHGVPLLDCEPLIVRLAVRQSAVRFINKLNTTTLEWLLDRLQPTFWRTLCPRLSVGGNWTQEYIHESIKWSPEQLDHMVDRYNNEGYFHSPPVDWNLPVSHDEIAQCIMTMRAAGWPGIFGFLFDDFWLVSTRLHSLLQRLLGDDYLSMPDMWVFYVDVKKADPTGWAPHRDRPPPGTQPYLPDGTPASVNIWLPLTNATTLNGCMYMLPKQYDKSLPLAIPGNVQAPMAIALDTLQSLRALVATPGEVLGWDGFVAHWGSAASPRATAPRLSIAIEYQRGNAVPMNQPLRPASHYPLFHERLATVSKQFINYGHIREVSAPKAEQFANLVYRALIALGLDLQPRDTA